MWSNSVYDDPITGTNAPPSGTFHKTTANLNKTLLYGPREDFGVFYIVAAVLLVSLFFTFLPESLESTFPTNEFMLFLFS